MIRHLVTAFAATLIGTTAAANSIRSCDTWEANARNLVLPPEDSIRAYANGNVQILHLDTGGSPACCSSHLMVLTAAPEDEFYDCALISFSDRNGFAWLTVAETQSTYDPASGLLLEVPARIYLPEESFTNGGMLTLLINQGTGQMQAAFIPGPNE